MSKDIKNTRRRLNIIDVVIILLVLALVATGVYKIYTELTSGTFVEKQGNYILTFECDSEYNSLLKYLKDGDKVYFNSDGTAMGCIYDFDKTDKLGAVYSITDEGSSSTTASSDSADEEKDEYKKIKIGGYIKLVANAEKAKQGNHYIIEGKNLTVGGKFTVYTEDTVFALKIVSIDAVE